MKLIIQFSPASCYFLPRGSKYSPQHSPSVYVLSLMYNTKFHTCTKQQEKLQLNTCAALKIVLGTAYITSSFHQNEENSLNYHNIDNS
jgi:hypothetical protein